MLYSSLPVILGLTSLVLARPRFEKRTTFTGVSTFNDFIKQGSTVCGPLAATNPNHFGAASGDVSHDISPGRCDPPLDPDPSKWWVHPNSRITNLPPTKAHFLTRTITTACLRLTYRLTFFTVTKQRVHHLSPITLKPACPKTKIHCDQPTCFRVQNIGNFGSSSNTPTGIPIIVQIIDSCPPGHAQNYCKAYNKDPSKIVPPQQRCADGSTNYLDIDYHAYKNLTGTDFVENRSANLEIQITPVDCTTET